MARFPFINTLMEGGWLSKATQSTTITPETVRLSLQIMEHLVREFNDWLSLTHPHVAPVELGPPTGSGYHHATDAPNKEYGDIDLQMVAENPQGASHSSYSSQWNNLWQEWAARAEPHNLNLSQSTPGHPMLEVPEHGLVQVDLMWHEPHMATWGLARSVPPVGIKGLLNGNLFGTLAQMLGMSIQHSGVQIKTQDGTPVPFSKQKGTTIHTISDDPHHFLQDILAYVASAPVQELQQDKLLQQNPGVKWPNPSFESFIRGIHGLAHSFELNHLYGQGVLRNYRDAQDFLLQFWNVYENKAQQELANPKRTKAETDAARDRAARDIASIQKGLDLAREIWHKL